MSEVKYKKLYKFNESALNKTRYKDAGLYEGSDGSFYFSDGINPPIKLTKNDSGGGISEDDYDTELKAFLIKD